MPARTVRCLLSNQTDFTFSYVSDHHDYGEYTGSWIPPASVAPGQVVEWRSESNGFMQGTQGTAKYSMVVLDQAGAHTEILDVWWDNPFYGHNSSDIIVREDFTGNPSRDVHYASVIQTGDAPNVQKVGDIDVEAWFDTLLFPPYLIANASFANDTIAFYGVRFKAKPGNFSGSENVGTRSEKANLDANPAQWSGTWLSNDITVSLVSLGGKRMTVNITDHTANPTLQFSQDFELGALTWVADHSVVSMVTKGVAAGSPSTANTFLQAASEARHLASSGDGKTFVDQFSKIATETAAKAGTRLTADLISKAVKSIGSFTAHSKSTVVLQNGVFITLYDIYVGNTRKGQELYYERHGASGVLLASASLTFLSSVR